MKIKLIGKMSTRQIWLDGKELLPDRSQEVYNHSPDGFNWGYSGSGPSQLALAIMLEVFGTSREYQKFKQTHIAPLPKTDFDIELEV